MKIHLYDFLNKNKKGILRGEDFSQLTINHTIDDFSSAQLSFGMGQSVIDTPIQGFDNIYIEDDQGRIIYGGIIAGYSVNSKGGVFESYDHRWVLSRLILDEPLEILEEDDLLAKVDELIDIAKAKRVIPLDFYREGSAINDHYRADLRFEVGDNIASCLQKIIQTIYARWAVRYYKSGNDIYGQLIVRSVLGVTPEGVGISRTTHKSEDGEIIKLLYSEGSDRSNIQEFNFHFDLSQYTSRAKIGAKIDNAPVFVDTAPVGISAVYESIFGRAEGYTSDYKANSYQTAQILSQINQTYPRQDIDVVLNPNFTTLINCGDRVNVVIDSPVLDTGNQDILARIDSVTYSQQNGYLERRMLVNTMSPQKRNGANGFLQKIIEIQESLDGLDKNYFNSE